MKVVYSKGGIMSNRPRFFLIALVVTVLLTLINTEGCSNKKEEPPRATVQAPTKQAAKDQAAEAQMPASDPHQVDACQRHRYYIAPGETATVTFETEVKSDVAKATGEGEPNVNKAAMEAAGYSVSYASRSIDTFSRPRPVWTVFNSDFAAKEREVIYETTTAGVTVRWKPDGSGTIEKLGDVRGPFEVGKLTSEDISKKLGTDTIRMIRPGNKTYMLSPSQGSMDEEMNILSVTLNITVPKDTDKIMQEKICGVFWKGGGISFRGYYSNFPGVKKYIIAGPAKSRDCFDR
jgi:hypothetical protein